MDEYPRKIGHPQIFIGTPESYQCTEYVEKQMTIIIDCTRIFVFLQKPPVEETLAAPINIGRAIPINDV